LKIVQLLSSSQSFTDVSGSVSVPIFRVCWWFGSTNTPAHSADGDEVISRNVGKPLHLDAVVCPRKFYWILSPRKLQDL